MWVILRILQKPEVPDGFSRILFAKAHVGVFPSCNITTHDSIIKKMEVSPPKRG